MRKIIQITIYLLIIGVLVFLFVRKLAKPLPGELMEDLGGEHVTDIADVIYNSNPPTSGTHFPMWAKKGIYDRLISDGYLIHSMEHGYVILWYDCTKKTISRKPYAVSQVLAHDDTAPESTDSGQLLKHMKLVQADEMSAFTPENAPAVEVELPEEFKSDSCKNLIEKLSEFVPSFERVIVIPRVGMDTEVALTAWTRIERLEKFDREKILEFIKAYHNKGPEKTVEN